MVRRDVLARCRPAWSNTVSEAESKEKHAWCMGHYSGVDYNLTLRPFQSQLQHIYHGQPYARVDFIPHSGTCMHITQCTLALKCNFPLASLFSLAL
jgi:hypothetical protein